MAQRLVLVAHAPTAGTRELIFGDRTELTAAADIGPLAERVVSWGSGPEPACVATARALGGEPEVIAELAGPDFGRWSGQTLTEVGTAEPEAVGAWLRDPAAAPHGGESLTELIRRVGACCDSREWAQGRTVVVVAPLVARAAAVHALGAAPEVIFRMDLAPLGRVGVSRAGESWRLQQLGPGVR
ncbi:MAG: histidine phosphatase family protein [Propionibacteriaceae bacterium]